MQRYPRIRRWALVSGLALVIATVVLLGTSGAKSSGTGGIPAVLRAIFNLGEDLSSNAADLKDRIDKLEAQHAASLAAIEAQQAATAAQQEAILATLQDLAINLRVDCGAPPDLVVIIESCGETAIVRNEGGSTAGESLTRVTVNGTSVTDIPTPALDPGDEFPIDIPCQFTPDCSIEIDADINDAVNESDETNNDASCGIIG